MDLKSTAIISARFSVPLNGKGGTGYYGAMRRIKTVLEFMDKRGSEGCDIISSSATCSKARVLTAGENYNGIDINVVVIADGFPAKTILDNQAQTEYINTLCNLISYVLCKNMVGQLCLGSQVLPYQVSAIGRGDRTLLYEYDDFVRNRKSKEKG